MPEISFIVLLESDWEAVLHPCTSRLTPPDPMVIADEILRHGAPDPSSGEGIRHRGSLWQCSSYPLGGKMVQATAGRRDLDP